MMGSQENAITSYGSIARKLLRKSPGAVLLVHPELNAIERVVLALGSYEPTIESAEMGRGIAMAGIEWALADAPIHVLHAWRAYGESVMAQRLSTEELFNYIDAERKAAEAHFHETLESLPLKVPSDHTHLEEGSPESVVPKFASNPKTDLLVLGSVARMGLPGLLIGNTAESILEKVDCSFLVVKPADFVSPFE
jgi:nucleotide-binding universal stress UspA family protein